MTARRHHYISQCYMSGFAESRAKPKLFVVDLKEAKSFTTSPENVAHERDFHTVEVENWESDAVEKSFAVFEGEVSPALERIIAARSIQNEVDRGYLTGIAALFAIKNPGTRENIRQFHEQIAKRVAQTMVASRERWETSLARDRAKGYDGPEISYEDMRAFVEADAYRVDLPNERHLQFEMQAWGSVADLLAGRRWMLFRAPVGHPGFITSDRPVCLMWSDPARRGGAYSPGFGLKNTQVLLPISAELAMIGAFEIEDMEVDADDARIAQINGEIIYHARRQIYAKSDQFAFRFKNMPRDLHGYEMVEDIRCRRNVAAGA